MKKIGKVIVKDYSGKIPKTEERIKKLPGVGLYIGNAILCFGFGQKKPILDANTSRVIGRFFSVDYKGDLRSNEELQEKARDMLPDTSVRHFNWALLDIGALLCDRDFPRCSKCPLNIGCDFYQDENVVVVPVGEHSFSKALEEKIYAFPSSRNLRVPDYIAFYRTKPVSAVTHLGKVSGISIGEDLDLKYRLLAFGDRAREEATVVEMNKIKELDEPVPYTCRAGIQGATRTSLRKLQEAVDVSGL